MTRLFCLTLTLTGVVTAPQLPVRAADQKDNLLGTWVVVKSEEDGKPSADLTKAKLTFKTPDQLFIKLSNDPKPLEVVFKLDATKKPKQIDLARNLDGRTETATGIYELDGDKLRLCIAEPAVKERPSEFKSKSRKVTYLELTREKP